MYICLYLNSLYVFLYVFVHFTYFFYHYIFRFISYILYTICYISYILFVGLYLRMRSNLLCLQVCICIKYIGTYLYICWHVWIFMCMYFWICIYYIVLYTFYIYVIVTVFLQTTFELAQLRIYIIIGTSFYSNAIFCIYNVLCLNIRYIFESTYTYFFVLFFIRVISAFDLILLFLLGFYLLYNIYIYIKYALYIFHHYNMHTTRRDIFENLHFCNINNSKFYVFHYTNFRQ